MVTMSQKEFQRVKVIENAAGGRLSVREASRLLHLSERQVQRLKRRHRPDSVGWVSLLFDAMGNLYGTTGAAAVER
jgi:Helix-turn-helix domain